MVSLDRTFLDKIFPDEAVRQDRVPEFFYPRHLVPTGEERFMVDPFQESGDRRPVRFGQLEMCADILNGDPLL